MYLVHYHQISPDGTIPSFHEEQYMEFVDINPIVARRHAFFFAKSYNTKPTEIKRDKKENPLPVKKTGSLNQRWCQIDCIQHGEILNQTVYYEGRYVLTSGLLKDLQKELSLYRKLGYITGYDVIKIVDEDGITYEVIGEENGFSS